MLIGEIVQRKEYLKLKIRETEKRLAEAPRMDIEPRSKGALYSDLLDTLFDLLSKLQSHKALLDRENAKTKITVGDSELSVIDAIHIRNTIERKIDTLTEVVEGLEHSLGYKDLITKRDQLMEEFVKVTNSIERSDWSTDWQEQGE